LLGAAGALEAAFTVMSLVDKVVPPTRNLNDVDGKSDFQHATKAEEAKDLRAAISNSFGFGGTNASLLFKTYE
jgi:3-oxoacyl-[acyl-carrier-protein] synthase II